MIKTKSGRVPLYKKVTDQLRQQCLASEGAMLPSLRQLSQTLDVNHATISRALRDLEQEGIVEIVPRKGIFSVARPTANAGIELVVFVNDHTNLLDVALQISRGMTHECQKPGAKSTNLKATRSVLSVSPLPSVEQFVTELRSRDIVGIGCLGFGFLDGELAAEEESFIAGVAQKMPVVLVGSPHPVLNLDCVYSDPNQQMREFLEHCHAQGARHFEYLGDHGNNLLQRQRRETFQQFAKQAGLDWQWNDLKTQDASQLAAHLHALPQLPEVVVATNVRRALTIVLEAQRRGLRLPDDLQVLCFASVWEHAEQLLPYASVIMLDEPAVGAKAVQILKSKLAGKPHSELLAERVPANIISGPLSHATSTASVTVAA